ncbi:hypothetical protein KQX54_000698 [Cotesia glomerata]|uniref:Uncharacterized protein n=1 Tax=Cotesia glomerata TaxID=32391 RepID=A0AAV7IJU5_COTGL|nr:hypothetical protein KQX54_000698 [Cotesia glomerata]
MHRICTSVDDQLKTYAKEWTTKLHLFSEFPRPVNCRSSLRKHGNSLISCWDWFGDPDTGRTEKRFCAGAKVIQAVMMSSSFLWYFIIPLSIRVSIQMPNRGENFTHTKRDHLFGDTNFKRCLRQHRDQSFIVRRIYPDFSNRDFRQKRKSNIKKTIVLNDRLEARVFDVTYDVAWNPASVYLMPGVSKELASTEYSCLAAGPASIDFCLLNSVCTFNTPTEYDERDECPLFWTPAPPRATTENNSISFFVQFKPRANFTFQNK